MTIEELEQVLGLFGALGLGGMLGGGLTWLLVKSFIPAYLAEKGKNHATKEDIGLITREVESVKIKFALQLKELEHQKMLLAEGFKSTLSQQQEFVRTANAATVELTKKLAMGSHLISWLAWHATQAEVCISDNDFTRYDTGMINVLSDLVGLQASVAALDPSRFAVLSQFAEQIYARDGSVGHASALYRTGNPEKITEAIALLKPIYHESLAFDQALLSAVTGLLATHSPNPSPQ